MRRILTKPYAYWTIGIFIAYIGLNIFISQFYVTIAYIPYYVDTINWAELILSGSMALIIGALISANAVSAYIKYKERISIKNNSAVTCAGTFAGLSTGICPACVTGAFPMILSFLGVSFSWASLPLNGLEIQLFTIFLLGISLFMLWRK